VPTTTGGSRGRQGGRSRTPGARGEHLPKIMTALVTGSVVVILVLVVTKAGRDIDAATQRFMLFYAGVFALIGLTASVGIGLMATDRIIMTPGHRVMAQAVHRAVSFGALAFLVIHIVTEILAQRVHVIDAFIPFLSPYRTFYIGLGTIASDLILLVVVTSIFRKRFTAHGKAWRWRAIHYTSYLAFVFGVLHGLLGGRTAKPYVDWSYGFAIALTALALVVRFLAVSLRPKDSLSAPPSADRVSGGLGYSGASPLRAAALGMAQARLGGTIQVLPASAGLAGTAVGLPGSQDWAALPPAPGRSPSSGPFPAISASPAYGAYQDAALMPLGAPVYGDGVAARSGSYPYAPVDPPRPALTGPGSGNRAMRQPRYEPGYDGPPRFEGAPRKHVPQDEVSSYPYGPQSYRPPPGTGHTDREAASRPRAGRTGAVSSSPRPSQPSRAAQPDRNTGPIPRVGTGPMPHAGTGPMPRAGTGPMPRAGTGPMPRAGTGPMPRAGTGPQPRAGTGPMPRADTGPQPRADTGPMPRADTGPMPRAGGGPAPRADSGPMARSGTGPNPRAFAAPGSRTEPGPMPRTGSWPRPDPRSGPRTGPMPTTATRPSRRANYASSGRRDIPGRSGGADRG
jgi:DMSO/TMAO reductase YedYZ heme-binding membrane subunit